MDSMVGLMVLLLILAGLFQAYRTLTALSLRAEEGFIQEWTAKAEGSPLHEAY